MKKVKSCNIQIWCGLKETDTQIIHSIDEVKKICQKYVDKIGECVSITETTFCYTKGIENGVCIGFINYPRFPRTKKEIIIRSIELADKLMVELNQYKVTVTTQKKTYMLENYNLTKLKNVD